MHFFVVVASLCVIVTGVHSSTPILVPNCTPSVTPPKTEKVFRFFPTKLSIAGAKRACKQNGGVLASVESEEQHLDMVNQVGGQMREEVWLSGERSSPDQCFVWTTADNRPLSYTHWLGDKPPSSKEVGCVFLTANAIDGYTWRVGDCQERKFVLCEI